MEQTKKRDELKLLREKINSKKETTMILPKNMSSITTSTNTQVKRRRTNQASNSFNDMLYQVPKKC